MEGKAINSVDELNIDSFFREQPVKDAVADESEEDNPDTSEDAPDEKTDVSKKRADEDSDDDIDLEDDDSEEDEEDESDDEDEDDSDDKKNLKRKEKKKDATKGIEALKKQAENAEQQRKQMQSEKDKLESEKNAFKAQAEEANSKIDSLTERIDKLTKLTEKLTKKAEQQDASVLFTGDDDALMTEGQIKKLLERQAKSSEKETSFDTEDKPLTEKEMRKLIDEQLKKPKESGTQVKEQPKIGSDEEAQDFWIRSQPDVEEVGSYYNENKATLDPELVSIPTTTAGRYAIIRAKRMEAELRSTKKALRKAKQKLKRMDKGELPETASSKRSNKPLTANEKTGDAMIDFFSK